MAGELFRKVSQGVREKLGKVLPVSFILPLYALLTIGLVYIIIGPVYKVYRNSITKSTNSFQLYCAVNVTHFKTNKNGGFDIELSGASVGNDCPEFQTFDTPDEASAVYIEASIAKIDAEGLTASMVFQPSLKGNLSPTFSESFSAQYLGEAFPIDVTSPILKDDTNITFNKYPSDYTLKILLNGEQISAKIGDKPGTKKVDIPLVPNAGAYDYPFDNYNISLDLSALIQVNFKDQPNPGDVFTAEFEVPLILGLRTSFPAWNVQADDAAELDNVVVLTYAEWGGNGASAVGPNIVLKRASITKFFSVFIVIIMWALATCAFVNAIDVAYVRTKEVVVGDVAALTGLLFALPNVRKLQPGVPDVGTSGDLLGFYWNMAMLSLAAILVFCVLVGQYAKPKEEKKEEKKDEKANGKEDAIKDPSGMEVHMLMPPHEPMVSPSQDARVYVRTQA